MFYESFATTAELQTKVAAKLGELESAGKQLSRVDSESGVAAPDVDPGPPC
ncbi:hypothetical protein [Micromonospora sp. 067-2]|uniref:hypothetical protein n=1 Tax=Micromonospora sp. 067-2 TaxID=2789270 RepID=UPI00397D2A51